MASPLWGHSSVPAGQNLAWSVHLCGIDRPLPPMPDVPLMSPGRAWHHVEQLADRCRHRGHARSSLPPFRRQGDFIGLQMGLAFATFFSPDTGNTMILARILYMITLLMFLAFNGHLMVPCRS